MSFFVGFKLVASAPLLQRLEKYKKEHSWLSWVHQEDLHVTLLFLGELGNDDCAKWALRIQSWLPMKIIHCMVREVGVFSLKHQQIAFIDLSHDVRLLQWSKLLKPYGLHAQYHPHITIARSHSSIPLALVDEAWEGELCMLDRIGIYYSVSHQCPRYMAHCEFELEK